LPNARLTLSIVLAIKTLEDDSFAAVTSLAGMSECRKANHRFAAAQTNYPARPQPKNRPEAYPLGYVEDLFEVRTQLGVCFSSRY
jgi:hypothetical protein